MKNIAIAIVLTVACSLPAHADQSAVPDNAPVVKRSFAERHPRLHKLGRKIRRACTVLLPVVEFAGASAQVVNLFL